MRQLTPRTKIGLLGLGAFLAGLGAARLTPGLAWAQEPAEEPLIADAEDGFAPRVMCRLFATDLEEGRVLETDDRTSEIGQWIGQRQAEGWQFYDMDFEVGQKPTGYPQGWTQVCLYPAR
jgi:hypothetical protein